MAALFKGVRLFNCLSRGLWAQIGCTSPLVADLKDTLKEEGEVEEGEVDGSDGEDIPPKDEREKLAMEMRRVQREKQLLEEEKKRVEAMKKNIEEEKRKHSEQLRLERLSASDDIHPGDEQDDMAELRRNLQNILANAEAEDLGSLDNNVHVDAVEKTSEEESNRMEDMENLKKMLEAELEAIGTPGGDTLEGATGL